MGKSERQGETWHSGFLMMLLLTEKNVELVRMR